MERSEPFDRLAEARTKAGFPSARSAAEAHGWNYSTYYAHEAGVRNFPLHAARKYARAYKVDLGWLTGLVKTNDRPVETAIAMLRPVGEVAAGQWIEEDADWAVSEELIGASPNPNYPVEHQVAFLVKGNSVNKIIRNGEYAIGIWQEHSRDVRDGDLVVVRRTRAGLVETTIKRYRTVNGAVQLLPESDDPRFQEAVNLDSGEDGLTVEIVARVVGSYRNLD